MSATVAPRMNEGNQISIYKYTGERMLKMEFKPDHVEGRHADTGGGARTKTQALLYTASWRPDGSKKYEDRAASPPRAGTRLPSMAKKRAGGHEPGYCQRSIGFGCVSSQGSHGGGLSGGDDAGRC